MNRLFPLVALWLMASIVFMSLWAFVGRFDGALYLGGLLTGWMMRVVTKK